MSDDVEYEFRPLDPATLTKKGLRVRTRYLALSLTEQERYVKKLLQAGDTKQLHELLDTLFERNPDIEDARRLFARDLARRGNWLVLFFMTREWLATRETISDPYAQLLIDLHELKELWKDPIRAGLLEGLISEVDARWNRPAALKDLKFE